jgi:tetratricopeptide (TPR) repeat protein
VKATQGYFFASQSRYEDALPFYAQAVELDPSNADAWFEYTDCLISLERSDEAREISSRGISNAPEPNRDLLIQQALLETPSKALGILFRLEHTCPGHDIKLYQAMLLTDLGRNDEAREILQKLNPEWFRGELAEKCRLLQRIHHIDLEEGQNDGA